jgi:hypothetical protein
VELATSSAFASTAGVAEASLNLDTAVLPATTTRLELWWFDDHEILGLRNLYKIDDLDVGSVTDKPRNVGHVGGCDGVPQIPIGAIGTTGSAAVLVSQIDTNSRSGSSTAVCVDLAPGIVPTRITRLLHAPQATVAYRGSGPVGADDGSLTMDVGPPAGTGDYRDHQAAVVISGLDIDPVAHPYLILPLTVSRVAALTIDAVSDDGSRITRYVPIQDRQDGQQSVLLNWESFPHYGAKTIAAIDIRIILPDDVNSERVNLGPLTLITGPDGLLSSTDFVARGLDQYEVRHIADGGLDGLTFLRDLR